MTENDQGWDRQRSEKLRAALNNDELEALAKRAESDPGSLTLDEVGVLFLVTRDRIKAIEAKARNEGSNE
jgi:DNA-directed RNA polymerase sigma subunit (sigma70/sigma32)